MGVSMDAGTKERLTKHQPAQEGRFSEPVGAAPQGVAAGAALSAAIAPSSTRQIKRAAHKAAKRVDEAVDHLAEAMDM